MRLCIAKDSIMAAPTIHFLGTLKFKPYLFGQNGAIANQSISQSNTSNQYQNASVNTNQSIAQSSTGVQLLDHSMAFYVDSAGTITRTNSFSTSDTMAYSWLNLGNVGASKIVWKWYSPDGNLFLTNSENAQK